jgi:hypothetical protein
VAKRTYNMVAVLPAGTIERKVQGAPDDKKMIEFGRKHGAKAVVRFYPKYQAFCVLDIRRAIALQLAGVGTVYRGHTRVLNSFDTEDAAVMAAMHMLD